MGPLLFFFISHGSWARDQLQQATERFLFIAITRALCCTNRCAPSCGNNAFEKIGNVINANACLNYDVMHRCFEDAWCSVLCWMLMLHQSEEDVDILVQHLCCSLVVRFRTLWLQTGLLFFVFTADLDLNVHTIKARGECQERWQISSMIVFITAQRI